LGGGLSTTGTFTFKMGEIPTITIGTTIQIEEVISAGIGTVDDEEMITYMPPGGSPLVVQREGPVVFENSEAAFPGRTTIWVITVTAIYNDAGTLVVQTQIEETDSY
jgi:hypothetical protein